MGECRRKEKNWEVVARIIGELGYVGEKMWERNKNEGERCFGKMSLMEKVGTVVEG